MLPVVDVLSSSLLGHIDFQIANINEVPKTKKHHLRVNQKLINHVLLALMWRKYYFQVYTMLQELLTS